MIVLTVVDAADTPDLADGHVAKPVAKDSLLRALDGAAARTPLVRH